MRSYNALLVLVPGVVTSANDIVTGTASRSFPIHGGRTNEGRLTLDGLTVGSPPSGNSATSYVVDAGQVEEVTFAPRAAGGEHETAGLVMNIVPRIGGNTLHGSLFASGTGGQTAIRQPHRRAEKPGRHGGHPADQGLRRLRLRSAGRSLRDRLWYFVNAHTRRQHEGTAPNVYYNLNAGDPAKWLYAPDFSRREYSDRTFENASGARHVADDAAQSAQRLLGRSSRCAATCTGATPGLVGAARVIARSGRASSAGRSRVAGHVVVTRHEPAARSTRVSAGRTSASATSSGHRIPRAI